MVRVWAKSSKPQPFARYVSQDCQPGALYERIPYRNEPPERGPPLQLWHPGWGCELLEAHLKFETALGQVSAALDIPSDTQWKPKFIKICAQTPPEMRLRKNFEKNM